MTTIINVHNIDPLCVNALPECSASFRSSRELPGGRTASSAALAPTGRGWPRPRCRTSPTRSFHQSRAAQTASGLIA
jgi:hypothetical protein